MKRYAIWDKKSPVITPSGEVFTAEQWMDRYPVARIDSITIICAYGEINGGIFATLGQMVQMAENDGCDFSDCVTEQEKLARIEEFEDKKIIESSEAAANAALNEEINAGALASIAASLEFQNMMSLPDEEV